MLEPIPTVWEQEAEVYPASRSGQPWMGFQFIIERQPTIHTQNHTYSQFRIISKPSTHVFGQWEEARVPRENLCKHKHPGKHADSTEKAPNQPI